MNPNNQNDPQWGDPQPSVPPQPLQQPSEGISPVAQPQAEPQPFAPQPPQPVATEQPATTEQPVQQPYQPFGAVPQAVEPAQPFAPQPQPFANTAPVDTPMAVPVAMAPIAQAQAPQAPQKKNKLVLLISIIAGAVLLLGGAIAAYFMLFVVTQSDYKQAHETIKAVHTEYDQMRMSGTDATLNTAEAREKRLAEVKAAFASYTENVDKLASEKAVKRDKQAAELYAAIAEKRPKFESSFQSSVEIIEYIAPALTNVTKTPATAVTELKAALPNIKDADNKAYAEKLLPLFENYETLAKKIEAMRDDPKKYDAAVIREVTTFSNDMSAATKEWQAAITKKTEDAEVNEEFKALSDYLAKKASGE